MKNKAYEISGIFSQLLHFKSTFKFKINHCFNDYMLKWSLFYFILSIGEERERGKERRKGGGEGRTREERNERRKKEKEERKEEETRKKWGPN